MISLKTVQKSQINSYSNFKPGILESLPLFSSQFIYSLKRKATNESIFFPLNSKQQYQQRIKKKTLYHINPSINY